MSTFRRIARPIVLALAAVLLFAPAALAQSATPPAPAAGNPILTPEFSAFVQQILILTLPPLAAAAVGYVIKALSDVWLNFKQSKPDVAWQLEQAAEMAVKAAEQTGLKNQWVQAGKAKYNLAFEIAQKYLEAQGLNVDGKLIGGAIEAAVIDKFPKPAAPAA